MSLFGINPTVLLMRLPAMIIALTVHEVSHGYIAMKLGDPTARNFGRLTLNPLKHIDPIGAISMLLFGFGWAKPVPINTRYFKKPRRDMALSALAGPVSNFLLAFVGLFLFHLSYFLFGLNPINSGYLFNVQDVWINMLAVFVMLNISLGVFNLIPVPPLDGSRIFLTFLPPKYYFGIMKYERYIMLGLFALLWIGMLDRPLVWISEGILGIMNRVITLIPIF